MPSERWKVECIGSSAYVSCWQIPRSKSLATATLGLWKGSTLGNDAVIIARELNSRGMILGIHLLNPTSADVRSVRATLNSIRVVAVEEQRGSRTRSLCIESENGERSWVFSRLPKPTRPLGEIYADVLYADYYPELVDYLNRSLEGVEKRVGVIFINISAISSANEMPVLRIRPSIIQASAPRLSSLDEALDLALSLAERAKAKRAFVTLGARGAVLAMGGEAWHSSVVECRTESLLGSGALFSAEVISGLSLKLDGKALLDRSVINTARRLQARFESHSS